MTMLAWTRDRGPQPTPWRNCDSATWVRVVQHHFEIPEAAGCLDTFGEIVWEAWRADGTLEDRIRKGDTRRVPA